jgi:hypothetical protein
VTTDTPARRRRRATRSVTHHVASASVAFAGAIYDLGAAMKLFDLTSAQQGAINLVILTGIGLAESLRVALNSRGARKRRSSS